MLIIRLNGKRSIFSGWSRDGRPWRGAAPADGPGAPPPRYSVLLHGGGEGGKTGDHVVSVLVSVFKKTPEEAEGIMRKVRCDGIAKCGTYSHEIAETKVNSVTCVSRAHGHPLACTMEPERP